MTSLNEQMPPASGAAGAAGVAAKDAVKGRRVRRFSADLSAAGEPALWGFGGALALGIILIAGFLMMVLYNGATTFWPKPIDRVELTDGTVIAGVERRGTIFRPDMPRLTDEQRAVVEENDGFAYRTLYQTANFDLYGDDFQWVADFETATVTQPEDFYYFERQVWGVFVGRIAGLQVAGQQMDYDAATFRREQEAARERFREIRRIERSEIGRLNNLIERERLNQRRAVLRQGEEAAAAEIAASQERIAELQAEFQVLQARVNEIRAVDRSYRVTLEEVGGRTIEPEMSQIVRYFPANTVGVLDKLGIYFSRWWEFVSTEPREANTQGGVLPAIFGTVAMTLLMVVFVAPFGVITALYLREYAKQGRVTSIVRISVNNLAGVPSIVYGVFGLGFFAYTMGGTIDQLFYPESLPNPTFGKGGILWASLTLALLTVPVVIVATEEALAAVPRSMREGSLACGASKWQTIRYVVLPKALPGIMTGMILAMARGAGEVAPLMLVGVVKLAPALPIDAFYPFIHLDRSFMHLGFHIFDVGFQSRNSEAGKPMVFVTTLLLLTLIVAMNATAIIVRNRLKRKYATGQF
ncbi:phosphate transport system permease protein [Roseinatronobacter thiooxidans]|uniref:Phosphate transport system permease protein PstA n=1 Tax=Roseinatronobacter thiooxidans TaxID=121821 RepID=A0A2W7QPX2_9RHOB|nr:phosphate ABC transporter permease PstA [Roseinatronobacter thiooxidans]PZX45937.1 phosphate transport system permease protein [Roseinatronobacter thiooxidans]